MEMDTIDVANTLTRMLHAIDAKDWDGVRREFASQLEMDYQSLFGDPPIRISGDDQVAGWRLFAGGFTSTQHLTGPIIVTPRPPDRAIANTHVRAYHQIVGTPGGDIWMVAGHYEVQLARIADAWKIAGITLRVFYQEGNMRIPDIARGRVASTRGASDAR
jgi:SnoaL-like domain